MIGCNCCGSDPFVCADCRSASGEFYLYATEPCCVTCNCHELKTADDSMSARGYGGYVDSTDIERMMIGDLKIDD